MLLLSIDESRVKSKIVWEDLYGHVFQFPHIYGELNLDAVVSVSETVEKDNYKMEVFNVSDGLIGLIFEKEFNPGEYEWKYNSTELSSGIYFYRLISSKNSIQKKFILLK